MSDDQFVLIRVAKNSGAPSHVYGPMTEEFARTLNEAYWDQGLPSAVMHLREVFPFERHFESGTVIYDPPAARTGQTR